LPSGLDAHRLARLEAVLFLAKEPLASRKLAQVAGLADGTQARTLVGRLRQRYDRRHSALEVVEVAGGFQLLTRGKFANWLRRLHPGQAELRLSAPALETLAVVAYRQPVLRAQIEAIRGVQCGEILRQLMDRDLVRIAGRSDELGRPFLYGTTKHFLSLFGMRDLDELPRAESLRTVGPLVVAPVENAGAEEQDTPKDSSTPSEMERELNVTASDPSASTPVELLDPRPAVPVDFYEDEEEDLEDEDLDFDDEDEDDLDDDEEDEEDLEEDDDLEDDEWEEVDDDDEDEEFEDEEEEDEWEEDDEDDEDWDDEEE
jgi:segregation and condensation protein B